eukprot:12379424-Heterocapsa_arctica.AAC.1
MLCTPGRLQSKAAGCCPSAHRGRWADGHQRDTAMARQGNDRGRTFAITSSLPSRHAGLRGAWSRNLQDL